MIWLPMISPRNSTRLWEQVKPLLRFAARLRPATVLREKYGRCRTCPPALFFRPTCWGTCGAQGTGNISTRLNRGLLMADPGYDLTELLKKRNTDWKQMVKYGEGFFNVARIHVPAPKTFWGALASSSRPERPRTVVCHAKCLGYRTRWTDVRLKMWHSDHGRGFPPRFTMKLGHNFLSARPTRSRPPSFRDSANDGFHESGGATPSRLPSITAGNIWRRSGCSIAPPDTSKDIGTAAA